MIKFFFIIPLLLSLIWWQYLRINNWSIEQGKRGFFYIIAFSVALAAFFGLMYGLNHYLN
ncbi:hypothetical protein [Psychrosphaera haliotis]|uniref:Uncharacterized protein n=1 Tax=Psychrosphaera haliotis TaxID=555083 RepID=A0A6N8FFV6_9GAMM|nr:hypothetical protein [Psychrosphaera haliotis]MDB2374116.1 hypothetical protein [Psychrosphaera haliotis]MUH73141.1 hypothetical protein [Psychrosphaera haliotis]